MNISLKKCFNSVLILLLLLYIFATGNILQKGFRIYEYGIAMVIVAFLLITRKKLIKSGSNLRLLIIICYWSFGVFYSINVSDTFYYVKVLITMYPLLFYELDDEFINKFFKYCKIIILIGAISCFLSVIDYAKMSKVYQIFLNKQTSYTEFEINGNSFSGLFGEKSNAAFCLDIGIGIILSQILINKKYEKSNIVLLIIYILALILTNKRMLLVIPIFNATILFALSNQNNKLLKGSFIGLASVLMLILLINTVPKFAAVFERFQTEGDNRQN